MYVCIRKAISYILFALLLQSTLAAILGFPHRGFPISGIHVISFSCVPWISQHAQASLPLLSKSCFGPYQEEMQLFKSVSFSESVFLLIHICYLLTNLCEECMIWGHLLFGWIVVIPKATRETHIWDSGVSGSLKVKTINLIAWGGCSGLTSPFHQPNQPLKPLFSECLNTPFIPNQ